MCAIILPSKPCEITRQVASELGIQIWPVGGCVRDLLLGRPVHDWDFVVDKDALGVARAVAERAGGVFYPLDEERDIGRVVLPCGDRWVELDFARLRGSSLKEDLLERDFTINAMAIGPNGELIDPVGGLADLQARLVRAISSHAFVRDPIRLLRAVRFVAGLNLQLEKQTAQWITEHAHLLSRSSPERIRDEFIRLLNVQPASRHLQLLDELGLMVSILPDTEILRNQQWAFPHHHTVWWHTLATIEATEQILRQVGVIGGESGGLCADVPNWAWNAVWETLSPFFPALACHLQQPIAPSRYRRTFLVLAALLHDTGRPFAIKEARGEHFQPTAYLHGHRSLSAQRAREWMREMRFSKTEEEYVAAVVQNCSCLSYLPDASGNITKRAAYRFFQSAGQAGVGAILLALADCLATRGASLQPSQIIGHQKAARALLEYFFHQSREGELLVPLVSGHDLMIELGIPQGPEVGRLLREIREAQAAGEITTREEALDLAKRLRSSAMSG